MDIYKKAAQTQLRFSTTKGVLSVENLFDLKMTTIAEMLRNLKKTLKVNTDDDLSFLDEKTVVDEENQLRFDILKDVYITKRAELDSQKKKLEDKAHNEKIMSLINMKEEERLKNLSKEELESMLR